MKSMGVFAVPMICFLVLSLLHVSFGQGVAPSPAPAGPSNDGNAIDQGIAYVLMVAALVITYFIH